MLFLCFVAIPVTFVLVLFVFDLKMDIRHFENGHTPGFFKWTPPAWTLLQVVATTDTWLLLQFYLVPGLGFPQGHVLTWVIASIGSLLTYSCLGCLVRGLYQQFEFDQTNNLPDKLERA